MDYRIETKPEFKVIGKSELFTTSKDYNREDLPEFWDRCHQDGVVKMLYSLSKNTQKSGMVFGICCDESSFDAHQFPYLIAAAYDGGDVPKGFIIKEIPQYTWAVFKCIGAMPKAIQDLWNRIYTEFFPTSDYRPANGIDLEAYYEGNMGDENYDSEIWIPIEKK